MESAQSEVFADDKRQAYDPKTRLLVRAKLAWYAVTRPFWSAHFKKELAPLLKDDPIFRRVDLFLNGDGGMFKSYAYARCARLRPLRGASVLVPGAGYGRNLWQLAAFRPKEIVAFDLYEYPEGWQMVAEEIRAKFGVPITFLKGDFDALPRERLGSFDHVISDAVLEHVPDMAKFAAGSRGFLKPGGVFYASFGPLWYGPSGDHVTWSAERLFDHLLLPEEEYKKQLAARSLAVTQDDSCDPGFMIQKEFFSYQKAHEYLAHLEGAGLNILEMRSKASPEAIALLRARPDIAKALDAKGAPLFDRYSAGLYLWARKPSP